MQKFLNSRKWVILFSGALIQIFTGVPAAWGVFQGAVCSGYKLNEHSASMIFSFIICSFGIGCIIGGYLQDKKGPRFAAVMGTCLLASGFVICGFLPQETPFLMYLFFSVPVGLGTALLYPAVMACAQKWYSDRKGFATGVIGGATGLSGAVLTLLGTWLINTWGIRMAFVVLGLIMAIVCGLACIVLENPIECNVESLNLPQNINQNMIFHLSNKKHRQEGKSVHVGTTSICEKVQNRNVGAHSSGENSIAFIFKTPQYYLLTLAVCFASPAMILFSPLIVQIAQNRGLVEIFALSCVAIGSFFSAVGRLTMPWLSDKTGRKFVFILLFSTLFVGSIGFLFASGIFVLITYCVLAFCYSGEAAVLPSTVTDLYGQQNTGVHYGFVALGMSIGSIAFPLLTAVMGGAQTTRHLIAIISTFLGLICVLFLKPIKGGKL